MSSGATPASETAQLPSRYESSLPWRLVRPLRALAGRRRGDAEPGPPEAEPAPLLDGWLRLFAAGLDPIEAACGEGGPERFALFRPLDADLWALLLTREYSSYPRIRALLPDMPDPALQEVWNGASGVALATQGAAFYRKLGDLCARHGGRPLEDATVLDFGCGWGRLLRFLARDVEPGRLFGCDPVEAILDVCRRSRVPATLARSEFVPERLPFDERFDLAYSFSVFTHVSEAAADACLDALHAALRPGGLLVATIRPPDYLLVSEHLAPARAELGEEWRARLDEPRYVFVPHPVTPDHPQFGGGDMTYGESIVTLPYVRERWTDRFELAGVDLLVGDLHQVVLTLRRR